MGKMTDAELLEQLKQQGGDSLIVRDWKPEQVVRGKFNGYRYEKRPQDQRATPFIKIGDKEYAVTDLTTTSIDKEKVQLGEEIAIAYFGKKAQKRDPSKSVHVFKFMRVTA